MTTPSITEPLAHSPAFSTTNLSEISDFELIDQDRDAWSSNAETDLDDRSPALSRNSSVSLLHAHSHSDGEAVDHSTDAWDSMHLVNPARLSSDDLLNERNEFVAEKLGNDASSIDDFSSVRDVGSQVEREENSDLTLTEINTSLSDPVSVKETGDKPVHSTAISSSDAIHSSNNSSSGSSSINLVFPDPIPMEDSVLSVSNSTQSLTPPGPDIPASAELEVPPQFGYEVEDIDTDMDIPSSAHFTSTTTSSLYSLSPNNSVLSFNLPAEINVEEPLVQALSSESESEQASDSSSSSSLESKLEEEQEFQNAQEEGPANATVQLIQEDHVEQDDLPHIAGGLPPIPFQPSRDRPAETVRELVQKEKIAKNEMHKNAQKGVGRRLESISRRNLIVSVLSVIICSAACILYGWKATVSKFDISLGGFNRSSFTSASIFSNLRSSALTSQDTSKVNSSISVLPSPVAVPSPSPSSIALTIDPTPVVKTIDGPTPRLLLSSSQGGTSATPLVTGSSSRKDIGVLLPKALSKYIPPSSDLFSSSGSSSAPLSSSRPLGLITPRFDTLKSKLDIAHSALTTRHARAKANAKKLGALGKRVLNKRCGPRCEGALSEFSEGLERVGGAVGRFRVGVRREVGGER